MTWRPKTKDTSFPLSPAHAFLRYSSATVSVLKWWDQLFRSSSLGISCCGFQHSAWLHAPRLDRRLELTPPSPAWASADNEEEAPPPATGPLPSLPLLEPPSRGLGLTLKRRVCLAGPLARADAASIFAAAPASSLTRGGKGKFKIVLAK